MTKDNFLHLIFLMGVFYVHATLKQKNYELRPSSHFVMKLQACKKNISEKN
jgi:hypothetical protein